MSLNQSRSDKNEPPQNRRSRRSGKHASQRNFSGGGGRGGGNIEPPSSSQPANSDRGGKKVNNAQGGQSRAAGSNVNARWVSKVNNAQGAATRAHSQPSIHGAAYVPMTGVSVKPTDESSQKSSQGVSKAPASNVAAPRPDTTAPATPAKAPGDPSRLFPLQFGSYSPGFMNGMEVGNSNKSRPRREASSAPPQRDSIIENSLKQSNSTAVLLESKSTTTGAGSVPAGSVTSVASAAVDESVSRQGAIKVDQKKPGKKDLLSHNQVGGRNLFQKLQNLFQLGTLNSVSSLPSQLLGILNSSDSIVPETTESIPASSSLRTSVAVSEIASKPLSTTAGAIVPKELGSKSDSIKEGHKSSSVVGADLSPEVEVQKPEKVKEQGELLLKGSKHNDNKPEISSGSTPKASEAVNLHPENSELKATSVSNEPLSLETADVKREGTVGSRKDDVRIGKIVTSTTEEPNTSYAETPSEDMGLSTVSHGDKALESDDTVSRLDRVASKSDVTAKGSGSIDQELPPVSARGKKKKKEMLQKADAQGTTSELYMAYKGPEENREALASIEKLFEQVKQVNIDNAGTLWGVVGLIFDKALMEPTFCEMYANFCHHLAGELPDFSEDNEKITFKRLLLNKCQEEFERGLREQEEANRAEEKGEVKQTVEEREEKRIKARRRMLGNIRLIGELYKKRMLTERIMHECIKKLLGEYQNPGEEDVEALCKLMTTIGEMIDHPKAKEHMDAYFEMMYKLSNNMKLSSRVRFLLKDSIDLRNKWQQRRKVEGPKKIDEVHRDAAQEMQAQSSRLARGPSFSSSGRREQPTDFAPRGSNMLPSPNSQMGNFRGLSQPLRGYANQDARYEEQHAFETRPLSVPLRPVGDEYITLGPQGGLARGMSSRGQPSIQSLPTADMPSPAESRRATAGPNGYSSVSERTGFGSREDLASRYTPERFVPPSANDHSSQQESNMNYMSRDRRNVDRTFDRPQPTAPPARGRGASLSQIQNQVLPEEVYRSNQRILQETYVRCAHEEVVEKGIIEIERLGLPGFENHGAAFFDMPLSSHSSQSFSSSSIKSADYDAQMKQKDEIIASLTETLNTQVDTRVNTHVKEMEERMEERLRQKEQMRQEMEQKMQQQMQEMMRSMLQQQPPSGINITLPFGSYLNSNGTLSGSGRRRGRRSRRGRGGNRTQSPKS